MKQITKTLISFVLFVVISTEVVSQNRNVRMIDTTTGKFVKIHVLAIGISKYPNAPQIQLPGPANDAKAFSTAMAPVAETNILLTEQYASRRAILENLEKIIDISNRNDLIIFYCASHGITSFGDFFLLPTEAEVGKLLSTGFPFSTVTNAISSKSGIHSLIILDACQSGAIGFDITKYREGALSSIFVSSGPSEISIETTINGIPQGYFTHFIVKGLNGAADENVDGIVTLRELFSYNYNKVRTATAYKQHPVLIGTLDNDLALGKSK